MVLLKNHPALVPPTGGEFVSNQLDIHRRGKWIRHQITLKPCSTQTEAVRLSEWA